MTGGPDVRGPAGAISLATGKLTADARRAHILARALRHGHVSRTELARDLEVSVMTIHRDLGLLSEQGRVRRVRGGAVIRHESGLWPTAVAIAR
ncbi:DeoR family transcriptional regulator [Streptomyces sp. NPDC087917]|uniref:DeoR family transcriptional regulator n=1 Tax=unclassified Streptomyces TaxID=2593676 RepID=UPI00344635EB